MRPRLTVFSDVPQAFAPRAAWTLQTMLAPLGRRLALTREPAQVGGAALAYASVPLPGVPTIPCSAAALELLRAGRPLPAGAFAPRESAVGSAVGAFAATQGGPDFAVSFDLLASAFVLLACWDEHTSAVRDEFGRLPYSAAVFAANPALKIEEPAVDRYVELLRAVLAPRLAQLGLEPLPAPGWMWADGASEAAQTGAVETGAGGGARFAVALTHDIDHLWRWTPREFAAVGYRSVRALRRRDAAALRWSSATSPTGPPATCRHAAIRTGPSRRCFTARTRAASPPRSS